MATCLPTGYTRIVFEVSESSLRKLIEWLKSWPVVTELVVTPKEFLEGVLANFRLHGFEAHAGLGPELF